MRFLLMKQEVWRALLAVTWAKSLAAPARMSRAGRAPPTWSTAPHALLTAPRHRLTDAYSRPT
jgi:hypothetical protein